MPLKSVWVANESFTEKPEHLYLCGSELSGHPPMATILLVATMSQSQEEDTV